MPNTGKRMQARPAGSVGTGIRMSASWLSAMVNPMSAPNRCSVHGGVVRAEFTACPSSTILEFRGRQERICGDFGPFSGLRGKMGS